MADAVTQYTIVHLRQKFGSPVTLPFFRVFKTSIVKYLIRVEKLHC